MAKHKSTRSKRSSPNKTETLNQLNAASVGCSTPIGFSDYHKKKVFTQADMDKQLTEIAQSERNDEKKLDDIDKDLIAQKGEINHQRERLESQWDYLRKTEQDRSNLAERIRLKLKGFQPTGL